MKKSLLIIIYIIAIFFAVDSCYIVLVPNDTGVLSYYDISIIPKI